MSLDPHPPKLGLPFQGAELFPPEVRWALPTAGFGGRALPFASHPVSRVRSVASGATEPVAPSRSRWILAPALKVALRLFAWLSAPSLFAADFADLEPLLQQHCVECHGLKDPDGDLVLESHADLLKGGKSGPVVIPGKSAESRLVRALEGTWGKTGKNQFMPPGQRERLKPEAITLFKAWIDAGAPPSTRTTAPRELVVPKITPRTPPRRAINDLAFEPKSRRLALARPDGVELFDPDARAVVRTLTGLKGPANTVRFSSDGVFVFAGGGEAGQGEIRQWRVADGSLIRSLEGHRDAVYALAVTSDGRELASAGYDYAIKLWTLAGGEERLTLPASQGAILGLAFRPDGRLLASAGFDRTAKVYDAASGARLETLGEALKELNTLAFSPDGGVLVTGGNDNRLRAYRLGPEGKEGSNELLATVFAHEGALLRVAYSPDGRSIATSGDDQTVKLFDAAEFKPRLTLERQPDWPTALTFLDASQLAVGRADGSLAFYQTADGRPASPPKPELQRLEPRGVERGLATRVKLIGRHLGRATVARLYRAGQLRAVAALETRDGESWVEIEPRSDESPGAWEITAGDDANESARVKLWIDDLPQSGTAAARPPERLTTAPDSAVPVERVDLPTSVWSSLPKPGLSAEFTFHAQAGRTLVLDLAAQRLDAKGDFALTLLDAAGRTIAANDNYAGQSDPALLVPIPAEGDYRVRVTEATFSGSADHFFRLSLGELPFVTGVFPLSLTAGQDTEVELLGINLGRAPRFTLRGETVGEVALPDPAREWRSRREWKFLVTDTPTPRESEPNDTPSQATPIPVPVSVNGRFTSTADANSAADSPATRRADVDLFRFAARRGVTYVVETAAALRGSLADTRLAILWPDGRPVERQRFQSLRKSAITFRPGTSDDAGFRLENWAEMELNDLIWCDGEIMKIFRAPQGPDSDSQMYTSNGRRRGYFDTSPTAHYLEQPVYLIAPLQPGETPVPNGLPAFTLNHENDDAALRDLGSDSRLHFTAPADGEFLVQVTDARGFAGPGYVYRLLVREARPDFAVTLNGANPTVAAGSGQSFSLTAHRHDGYEGPIEVEIRGLPAGWTAPSPLVIEAGHTTASAPLHAAANATAGDEEDWKKVTVTAKATVGDRIVVVPVNSLGRPRLATEKPKLLVQLAPTTAATAAGESATVTITPGRTAQARLVLIRQGLDGVVTFSVDNLPHGVIVENLGLNGITFLPGETAREISLAAAKWVGELDRPFFAVENQAGRQTSTPLLLRVRRAELR